MYNVSFFSHDPSPQFITTPSAFHNLPPPTITWEQYVLLNLELDRLANSNKHLLVENEALQANAAKNAALASENDSLRVSLAKAEHEVQLLKCDTRRMFDLEIRIAALVKENQGFSSQLSLKLKDLDTWQLKYDEMNEAALRYSGLHDTRVAENEQLQVEILRMGLEIANIEALKNQLKQLTAKIKELEKARDDLKTTITQKEKENIQLKEKLDHVEEVKTVIQMDEEERQALKKLYEDSQDLVEELSIKRKEVEGKLELVSLEKEKALSIVEDKVKEIEELKETIKELSKVQESLAMMEKEKEQLKATADKKARDYDKSKEEIKQLLLLGAHRHKEIERLKSQVFNLTQNEKNFKKEKDKLGNLLLQKTKEIEELKVEIQYLIERNKNKCCSDASKSKHDQVQEDKEIKEYKNKMKRIADAERKLQTLLSENKRLTQENDRIGVFLIEKTKEAEKFRERKTKFTFNNMLTPKTSMASLGNERASFGELALRRINEIDDPRKSAPLQGGEFDESAMSSSYVKKDMKQTLMDKERLITHLSARVLDYERQLSNGGKPKRKTPSSEKKKFRRANTEKIESMKDLKVKTMTESISEFSTTYDDKDGLTSKIEKQVKKKLKNANIGSGEDVSALSSVLERVEGQRTPSPKKVVLMASEKPRLHAPNKKVQSVKDLEAKIMGWERAYSMTVDAQSKAEGDQSDTATIESPSPTRTSTVHRLSEELLSKRREKLREVQQSKSSAELRKSRTNLSFDGVTSPETSPLFDSKWF